MKNKSKIATIKYNALELRKNYQIPYVLCNIIMELDKDSREELIVWLMAQSENLIRIKGYYKKYPDIEKAVNETLESEFNKLVDKFTRMSGKD